MGKLKYLQRLRVSNTGLTALPDSIGNLSSLEILHLANNNLTSLPNSIRNLHSLRQITLKNNLYLRSVQQLTGLPSLKTLDARHCSIEKLPRDLPQLVDLYMSYNNLAGLNGIHTLGNESDSDKYFDFKMNRIRSVSPSILHVKNLFQLKLDNNELRTLPSDIFSITTLRDLSIDNNFLYDDGLKREFVKKFNRTYKSRKPEQ